MKVFFVLTVLTALVTANHYENSGVGGHTGAGFGFGEGSPYFGVDHAKGHGKGHVKGQGYSQQRSHGYGHDYGFKHGLHSHNHGHAHVDEKHGSGVQAGHGLGGARIGGDFLFGIPGSSDGLRAGNNYGHKHVYRYHSHLGGVHTGHEQGGTRVGAVSGIDRTGLSGSDIHGHGHGHEYWHNKYADGVRTGLGLGRAGIGSGFGFPGAESYAKSGGATAGVYSKSLAESYGGSASHQQVSNNAGYVSVGHSSIGDGEYGAGIHSQGLGKFGIIPGFGFGLADSYARSGVLADGSGTYAESGAGSSGGTVQHVVVSSGIGSFAGSHSGFGIDNHFGHLTGGYGEAGVGVYNNGNEFVYKTPGDARKQLERTGVAVEMAPEIQIGAGAGANTKTEGGRFDSGSHSSTTSHVHSTVENKFTDGPKIEKEVGINVDKSAGGSGSTVETAPHIKIDAGAGANSKAENGDIKVDEATLISVPDSRAEEHRADAVQPSKEGHTVSEGDGSSTTSHVDSSTNVMDHGYVYKKPSTSFVTGSMVIGHQTKYDTDSTVENKFNDGRKIENEVAINTGSGAVEVFGNHGSVDISAGGRGSTVEIEPHIKSDAGAGANSKAEDGHIKVDEVTLISVPDSRAEEHRADAVQPSKEGHTVSEGDGSSTTSHVDSSTNVMDHGHVYKKPSTSFVTGSMVIGHKTKYDTDSTVENKFNDGRKIENEGAINTGSGAVEVFGNHGIVDISAGGRGSTVEMEPHIKSDAGAGSNSKAEDGDIKVDEATLVSVPASRAEEHRADAVQPTKEGHTVSGGDGSSTTSHVDSSTNVMDHGYVYKKPSISFVTGSMVIGHQTKYDTDSTVENKFNDGRKIENEVAINTGSGAVEVFGNHGIVDISAGGRGSTVEMEPLIKSDAGAGANSKAEDGDIKVDEATLVSVPDSRAEEHRADAVQPSKEGHTVSGGDGSSTTSHVDSSTNVMDHGYVYKKPSVPFVTGSMVIGHQTKYDTDSTVGNKFNDGRKIENEVAINTGSGVVEVFGNHGSVDTSAGGRGSTVEMAPHIKIDAGAGANSKVEDGDIKVDEATLVSVPDSRAEEHRTDAVQPSKEGHTVSGVDGSSTTSYVDSSTNVMDHGYVYKKPSIPFVTASMVIGHQMKYDTDSTVENKFNDGRKIENEGAINTGSGVVEVFGNHGSVDTSADGRGSTVETAPHIKIDARAGANSKAEDGDIKVDEATLVSVPDSRAKKHRADAVQPSKEGHTVSGGDGSSTTSYVDSSTNVMDHGYVYKKPSTYFVTGSMVIGDQTKYDTDSNSVTIARDLATNVAASSSGNASGNELPVIKAAGIQTETDTAVDTTIADDAYNTGVIIDSEEKANVVDSAQVPTESCSGNLIGMVDSINNGESHGSANIVDQITSGVVIDNGSVGDDSNKAVKNFTADSGSHINDSGFTDNTAATIQSGAGVGCHNTAETGENKFINFGSLKLGLGSGYKVACSSSSSSSASSSSSSASSHNYNNGVHSSSSSSSASSTSSSNFRFSSSPTYSGEKSSGKKIGLYRR